MWLPGPYQELWTSRQTVCNGGIRSCEAVCEYQYENWYLMYEYPYLLTPCLCGRITTLDSFVTCYFFSVVYLLSILAVINNFLHLPVFSVWPLAPSSVFWFTIKIFLSHSCLTHSSHIPQWLQSSPFYSTTRSEVIHF